MKEQATKEYGNCLVWGQSLHNTPMLAAVKEMSRCFDDARDDPSVGVIILTGVSSPPCVVQYCTNAASLDPILTT